MEIELAEHAKDLDDRFYGLTRESLPELAFKLVEIKGIARPFNNNKAGRACVQGFVAHNTGTFQEKCVAYSLHLYCSFIQTNYFLKYYEC
jgi:hypothetical protein